MDAAQVGTGGRPALRSLRNALVGSRQRKLGFCTTEPERIALYVSGSPQRGLIVPGSCGASVTGRRIRSPPFKRSRSLSCWPSVRERGQNYVAEPSADATVLSALGGTVDALWSALHALEGDDVGVIRQLCSSILRALARLALAASRLDAEACSILDSMTSGDNLQATQGYLSVAATLTDDADPADRNVASDRASSACDILRATMRCAPPQSRLAEIGDPEATLGMLHLLVERGPSKVRRVARSWTDASALASSDRSAHSTTPHHRAICNSAERNARCSPSFASWR